MKEAKSIGLGLGTGLGAAAALAVVTVGMAMLAAAASPGVLSDGGEIVFEYAYVTVVIMAFVVAIWVANGLAQRMQLEQMPAIIASLIAIALVCAVGVDRSSAINDCTVGLQFPTNVDPCD